MRLPWAVTSDMTAHSRTTIKAFREDLDGDIKMEVMVLLHDNERVRVNEDTRMLDEKNV